ncbi:PDZ domain-containing protein [Planctomycetales bacterium ZRK34]|nr:PDZ domain-containing protein [Planctomycetales bacterium ZRK34]
MNRLQSFAIVIVACVTAAAFAAPEQEPQREREPGPDRPREVEHPAEHEREMVAYLGIATVPIPEELRAHVDLARGVGLMVMFVEPESPAAEAGLKRNDLLVKLGDQLLINHDQLSTLIHAARPGEEVALDVIQGGKHKTATVKLGSRPLERPRLMMPPEHRRFDFPFDPDRPDFERPDFEHPDFERPEFNPDNVRRQIERLERQLREAGLNDDQIHDIVDRLHDQLNRMNRMHRERPWREREFDPDRPEEREHPDRPRERERPEGAQTHARMTYTDGDHRLTITVEDGHKTLHAATLDGEELFEGPIDTPEQREKVPAPLREKLERLETQGRIDIRIHPDRREHRERPKHPEHPDDAPHEAPPL